MEGIPLCLLTHIFNRHKKFY